MNTYTHLKRHGPGVVVGVLIAVSAFNFVKTIKQYLPAALPDMTCSDLIDNDMDMLKDMADPDCMQCGHEGGCVAMPAAAPAPAPAPYAAPAPAPAAAVTAPAPTQAATVPAPGPCSDAVDNDNDGAFDNMDFSCIQSNGLSETTPKSQCQDGVDNDSNGKIDFPADPGCSSAQDNQEYLPPCSDAVDNDNDGAFDNMDFSCIQSNGASETTPKSQCQDGVDNDSNGKIDFPADMGCTSAQDNSED